MFIRSLLLAFLLLLPVTVRAESLSFNSNSGVLSLHSIVTNKEAVCVPEIAGQWGPLIVTNISGCDYQAKIDDESMTVAIRFRLIRLGGQLFADAWLENLPEGLSLAWHLPLRVRLNGNDVHVASISVKWLAGDTAVHPIDHKRFGDLWLLTATAANLHDLLTRTADSGEVFEDVTFHRQQHMRLACSGADISPEKGSTLRLSVPACSGGWTQWINRPGQAGWHLDAEGEVLVEYKFADGSRKHSLEGSGTDCSIDEDMRAMRFRIIDGKETSVKIEFETNDTKKPTDPHPCQMVEAAK